MATRLKKTAQVYACNSRDEAQTAIKQATELRIVYCHRSLSLGFVFLFLRLMRRLRRPRRVHRDFRCGEPWLVIFIWQTMMKLVGTINIIKSVNFLIF